MNPRLPRCGRSSRNAFRETKTGCKHGEKETAKQPVRIQPTIKQNLISTRNMWSFYLWVLALFLAIPLIPTHAKNINRCWSWVCFQIFAGTGAHYNHDIIGTRPLCTVWRLWSSYSISDTFRGRGSWRAFMNIKWDQCSIIRGPIPPT